VSSQVISVATNQLVNCLELETIDVTNKQTDVESSIEEQRQPYRDVFSRLRMVEFGSEF
jgi:hypothetical protein